MADIDLLRSSTLAPPLEIKSQLTSLAGLTFLRRLVPISRDFVGSEGGIGGVASFLEVRGTLVALEAGSGWRGSCNSL